MSGLASRGVMRSVELRGVMRSGESRGVMRAVESRGVMRPVESRGVMSAGEARGMMSGGTSGRALGARARATAWLVATFSCALAACTFSDNREHCTADRECGTGQSCYQGFCVKGESTAADGGGATRDDSGRPTTPGTAGTGSVSNPATGAGSSSTPSGGRSGGAGRAGAAGASTPRDAGTPPPRDANAPPECKEGETQPCLDDPASTNEACNRGTQRCVGGGWTACIAEPMPVPETCNGVDDDCNGMVDDQVAAMECYPDGQAGCTVAGGCQGICALGHKVCENGKYGDCTGFIKPGAEMCTPANGVAADENCNGVADETCMCTGNEMRSCYAGPAGTLNVGKCVAGTQVCSNGALGPCTNQVVPAAETCANDGADDDCNGVADDVKNRGAACSVPNNNGVCRSGMSQCVKGNAELTCVTPTGTPETCNSIDDDCNGKIDDTFDLMNDAANCGRCGNKCASGQACCGGQCSNPKTDVNNCGACGATHACGAGNSCCDGTCKTGPSCTVTPPVGGAGSGAGGTGAAGSGGNTCSPACTGGRTCCGNKCVDLNQGDPNNCGVCGNSCSNKTVPGCCNGSCVDLSSDTTCGSCTASCTGVVLEGDAGILCTCKRDGSGYACKGLLNLCIL